MFAFLEEVFALGIDRPAGRDDGKVGGIEERDRKEFGGSGWFIGWTTDHLIENELDTFFGDASAEAHSSNDGAKGVGDVFGAIAEVGFGGILYANMLLDLPSGKERPNPREQGVDEEGAAGHWLMRSETEKGMAQEGDPLRNG